MLRPVDTPPEWSYVLDFVAAIAWPMVAVAAILLLRKPLAQLIRDSESGTADLRKLVFSWRKAENGAKQGLKVLEARAGPPGEAVTPGAYAHDVRPTLNRSPRDAITRLYAELVETVDSLEGALTEDEERVFQELQRMHASVASGRLEANDKRVHEYKELVERYLNVVGGSGRASS